jgi:SPP1 family predicted phage head-tail adaptor
MVQDAAGGQTVSWEDIADLWCQITPGGGKELAAGGAVRAETTHSAKMRYHPQIIPKNRLIGVAPPTLVGRIFNITSVNNVEERNREMDLVLSEGLNSG